MSPCTESRINTNYERIASWGGCQCWTGDPWILETPLAAHYWSQRLNHSPMTHPSKTVWHQLSGIIHWLQERVDSGQERFLVQTQQNRHTTKGFHTIGDHVYWALGGWGSGVGVGGWGVGGGVGWGWGRGGGGVGGRGQKACNFWI